MKLSETPKYRTSGDEVKTSLTETHVVVFGYGKFTVTADMLGKYLLFVPKYMENEK